MMNNYPENDYRNYLMHWGKGTSSGNHKYISKHKSKSGKWVYVYEKAGDLVDRVKAWRKRKQDLKAARSDIQRQMEINDENVENFVGRTTADDYRDQGRATRQNKYLDPGAGRPYMDASGKGTTYSNKTRGDFYNGKYLRYDEGSHYNTRSGFTDRHYLDALDASGKVHHEYSSRWKKENENKKKYGRKHPRGTSR